MDREQLDAWFPHSQQNQLIAHLTTRVGVTRSRAECFIRLWVYLFVKQQCDQNPRLKPPLAKLVVPTGTVICTHREAADLFYSDKDQGSDRAAGMMLDKLAALGLITKTFDGNTTTIAIQPILEVLTSQASQPSTALSPDVFDPRCDAIPIANLLAANYNWMNHNTNAVPHRIARLLRAWSRQYATGMRVLRRSDNHHPVGFYLLYPTASESDANFFQSPSKGLYLSTMNETDPFTMATPNDLTCVSLYIRSWIIDQPYLNAYRVAFLQDAQQTIQRILADFPNLCDLHTLIIHPSYEQLASALGFQKTSQDNQSSIYWMYQAIDRFLALDITRVVL